MNRRELIGGAAALAASTAFTPPALAGLMVGSSEGAVPVPPTDNAGLSQVNFNFAQGSGAFPFMNALKGAQTWHCVTTPPDGISFPVPTTLDANGYPTTITFGGVTTVFNIPSAAQRPGNWRLTWQGTGTLNVSGLGSTGSQTNGSFTWVPGVTQVTLQITANPSANLSNVRVFHADDEAAINAGLVFNTKFKQKLRDANFGVLRFLNWMGPPTEGCNSTNMRKWADRKPSTYVYWAGDEMRSDIYGGVTAGTGEAYTLDVPPSSWAGLVDKAIVTVKWDRTATTNTPTLNVAGTGAITITTRSGEILGTSNRPGIGRFATLVYDQNLNIWIKFGGDSGAGGIFLANGVPPEMCAALCVEEVNYLAGDKLNAHPWFTTPFLSCDPIQDWQTSLATYIKTTYQDVHATSWMVPRYEVVPNETWNVGAGFLATRYAWAKAIAHWGIGNTGTQDQNDWVGQVGSTGGQAISAVYANDRTKYWAICGVQTSASTTQSNTRLNSNLYHTLDGGSQAYNWITHVCCDTYFSDTYADNAARQAAADAYAAAAGNAPLQLSIVTAFVDSCALSGAAAQYNTGLPKRAVYFAGWKAWAAGFGVLGLTAYEGGWSRVYASATGGGVTNVTVYNAFLAASKSVAGLQGYLTTQYVNFNTAGGAYPSCFQFSGANNVWSVLDPIYTLRTVRSGWE